MKRASDLERSRALRCIVVLPKELGPQAGYPVHKLKPSHRRTDEWVDVKKGVSEGDRRDGVHSAACTRARKRITWRF